MTAIEIPTQPNDDPSFVGMVGRVVAGLVNDDFPERLSVIRVDNWFDLKWLNFSGVGHVEFFSWLETRDTALDEFRQEKVTFPPFNPNRVVEEYSFRRGEGGGFSPERDEPRVHSRARAGSHENLHKRVADFADSAAFVWFSSHTEVNRRGSLMVYEVSHSGVHTWYAAFSDVGGWRVVRAEGITRAEVQSLTGPVP